MSTCTDHAAAKSHPSTGMNDREPLDLQPPHPEHWQHQNPQSWPKPQSQSQSQPQSQPRPKAQLTLIQNKARRRQVFSKRKTALMLKAMDLARREPGTRVLLVIADDANYTGRITKGTLQYNQGKYGTEANNNVELETGHDCTNQTNPGPRLQHTIENGTKSKRQRNPLVMYTFATPQLKSAWLENHGPELVQCPWLGLIHPRKQDQRRRH